MNISVSTTPSRVAVHTADEVDLIVMPVKTHMQRGHIRKLGKLAERRSTTVSGLIRHMLQTHPLFKEG